jgi:Flp pilus assembly pilin Flp
MTMPLLLERLIWEEDGQGVVEYALMTSLIALVCVVMIKFMRTRLVSVFNAAMVNMNTSSV